MENKKQFLKAVEEGNLTRKFRNNTKTLKRKPRNNKSGRQRLPKLPLLCNKNQKLPNILVPLRQQSRLRNS
jgi:hypothetical protein